MTIASEISRLQTAKANIKSSIEWKWVTVPSSAKLDSYDDYINQIEQIDITKIYYDYSAMQWPCPEWFHVPMSSEWESIISIWSNIWAFEYDSNNNLYNNLCQYLKLPLCWFIYTNANFRQQSTVAYYLSCSKVSSTSSWCPCLFAARSWYTSATYKYWWRMINSASWYWYSVRPFKNEYISPDNTRTVLYNWSSYQEWAWIFYNQSDWLISITDWNNWLTLSDKNLWATIVRNVWDSYSFNNSWYFYQQWNNFWFAYWIDASPTSTTQVNASDYSYMNPYSSSTFIKQTTWENPRNWDLWWWDTWVIPKKWQLVPYIAVTWISLNQSSVNMSNQSTYQLVATITPNDASNKKVIWTSSDNEAFSVSQTWLVTRNVYYPVTATITATTEDWWYTATCSVKIIP